MYSDLRDVPQFPVSRMDLLIHQQALKFLFLAKTPEDQVERGKLRV